MKLKDLIEKYGEYEVIDETKFKTWDATLPKERSGSVQIEGREGIQIRLEPPQPKSVWELKEGDKFTSIDVFGKTIENCTWEYNLFDAEMRKVGNVFLTQEDAESDVERRKVETLLLRHGGRRWFKKAPLKNFYIWLHKGRVIVSADSCPAQGTIYFDSREQAEKAIAEIGETYIKNILFEVR